MKINLPAAAVLFIIGAAAAFMLPVSFTVFFAAVFTAVCLIMKLKRGFTASNKIFYAVVFTLGVVLTQRYASADLKTLGKYTGKYITVTGRICELPGDMNEDGNTRYVLNVKTIKCKEVTVKANERVLLSAPESYSYGSTVTVSGFLTEFNDKMNSSSFDYKLNYKAKDVFFKIYAMKSSLIPDEIRDYSLHSLTLRVKDSISALIDKYTNNDKSALLKAIIIGESGHFSDEFDKVLERTGTKRFFYPAFLHIYLLIFIIGLFSGILKRKHRDTVLIILLIIYALCESSRPTFVKGCLLAALLILFRKRFGFVYFYDALAAVVLIVGISNPLMLYSAVFIMSVTATLLVSMFSKPLSDKMRWIKNSRVRQTLSISIICSIGLLPLIAYFFNGVSIYTVVTVFIFIPLTLGIIILSPLLLIMLALFGKAPIIGEAVTTILWLYTKIPYIINVLPFSYIPLGTPGISTIIAFYTCVYALWLRLQREVFASQVTAAVSAAMAFVTAFTVAAQINTMEINFVNVGQGDGAFIRMPLRRETVLIDGGGGSEYANSYNPGESVYLPYLQSEGIMNVPCAIISHCHKDHVQGIIAAVENLRVRHVYLPKTEHDNEFLGQLENAAAKTGCELHFVTENICLNFRSGLKIQISPPVGTALLSDDDNDGSLLVRVSYGDTDCLFTGDMTALSEQNFLRRGMVKSSEILKVAHHGSKTSTTQEFLDAVNPDYAVISVGEDNSYGLPSDEVLERLDGVKILRTDENGDIKITAKKDGIKSISAYKSAY